MKFILVVLEDAEAAEVTRALVDAGLRVTRLVSGGGLLRRGHSVFFTAVEDDKVDEAVALVRAHLPKAEQAGARRGMLFVLPVEAYIQA
ncbi:MAG: hypothetical protein GXO37_00200 [Chloroflexi bacterium]|nr:hypothetical protein [Chloroflexota bacterium]